MNAWCIQHLYTRCVQDVYKMNKRDIHCICHVDIMYTSYRAYTSLLSAAPAPIDILMPYKEALIMWKGLQATFFLLLQWHLVRGEHFIDTKLQLLPAPTWLYVWKVSILCSIQQHNQRIKTYLTTELIVISLNMPVVSASATQQYVSCVVTVIKIIECMNAFNSLPHSNHTGYVPSLCWR